jgi:ParB family chromosome partitioning protein
MAGKKQALGRGLGALFGEIDTKVPAVDQAEPVLKVTGAEKTPKITSENTVLYVDIDEIKPNSMQPRQSFDSETIEELAASIETYGVIQPIILKRAETGYELVAGERRWRAARKAGLKTVPSIVREVTNEENALIAIIENMQREDLNTIEEASAFKTIIGKYGMTQEELARAVGRSRPYISNTLRTLSLPPELVEMLRNDDLTLGHANALGSLKDKGQQVGLAKKIAKKGLSVREAERMAGALAQNKKTRKNTKNEKTNDVRVIEQELTSAIGIRVLINGNDEKGSVELRYFDRQGLDEIIDLLRNTGIRKS